MSTLPLRRAVTSALVLLLFGWPPLQLCASRSGCHSSWRFAGWGMYATPYPSPEQRPLRIVIDLCSSGEPAGPERPLRVTSAGRELSQLLATHAGLQFAARCAPEERELALSEDALHAVTALGTAARQLDPAIHLQSLAARLRTQLAAQGAHPVTLHLQLGSRRADPWAQRYGTEYQSYVYPAE